uniref:Uncharacterized protein n=1 Tax=Odontella aurita TaxID=265563 RepID=A0A7S4HKV7_9STRA
MCPEGGLAAETLRETPRKHDINTHILDPDAGAWIGLQRGAAPSSLRPLPPGEDCLFDQSIQLYAASGRIRSGFVVLLPPSFRGRVFPTDGRYDARLAATKNRRGPRSRRARKRA